MTDEFENIKTPQHMEFKIYAAFCSRLMTGMDIHGRWVQVRVNNTPKTSTDKAKYEVDARIYVDGDPVGVLDVERKPHWNGGPWPYPRINFPYRPFSHFENGSGFQRSFSSKAVALSQAYTEGRPAFWVAYSSPIADSTGQQMLVSRQTCLVVPADRIFGNNYGAHTESQPTRYGRDVKVVVMPNEAGILCSSENEFTDVIVSSVDMWLKSQEVMA
jgi:hypothetical protein